MLAGIQTQILVCVLYALSPTRPSSQPTFYMFKHDLDRKKLDSHSAGFWISVIFSLFCMGLTPLLSKAAISILVMSAVCFVLLL